MIYDDFIELPFDQPQKGPPKHDSSDCYPDSIPQYFIEKYTKAGDTVFDPFLGCGTSAFVAEEMGRIPYGIEADGERFEWAAGQLSYWQNIICDDSADMAAYNLPKMDFVITSPPFMLAHHKWNPLYGGDPDFSGYAAYLSRMEEVFALVAAQMKRGALAVVHADNLQQDNKPFTPLVRDFSVLIAKYLKFEADVIVKWQNAPDYYSHTHCLIFKK